jgi:acyl-coenzyme A synthetase/AMP-(fatty) acid ligase
MGLSVITSHLYAGSTILLFQGNLTDKKFWQFFKDEQASSFTGVPYSFEILYKLKFFSMNLPSLKLLTQGGGKLNEALFKEFVEYADRTNRKFIATYGQTEGTARMAYLPAELAIKKIGSIGKAIPNGTLSLADENGNAITTDEAIGEMVYHGPNVTLGYATNGNDLIKGDENNGVLFTGDIAKRDAEGFYYIIGRKTRFVKLYGARISLDTIEQLIKSEFKIDCCCGGNDDKLSISITEREKSGDIAKFIIEKTGIYHQAIEIIIVNEIPKNEAGKTIYLN